MANWITTLRLTLLFVLVGMVYWAPPAWQVANAPLLVAIFVLDSVDGLAARKYGEVSAFGAIYDIAADRIVENVLWIVLTDVGLVPVIVPIIFITRGFLVDLIRTHTAVPGAAPFSMMHTRLGRWLVVGRFMRFAYATAKAVAFGWILLIQPWSSLFPQFWTEQSGLLSTVSSVLVWLAVALCLARGLPVIVDAVLHHRARRPLKAASKPTTSLPPLPRPQPRREAKPIVERSPMPQKGNR